MKKNPIFIRNAIDSKQIEIYFIKLATTITKPTFAQNQPGPGSFIVSIAYLVKK